MSSGYIHGYTDEEAERLLAQAKYLEPLVFDGLDLSDVGTLLEVGVGVGAETQVLLSRWPQLRVLGVDVSQRSLERARHTLAGQLDRVQLVHGSGARLPLADRSVDAALFVWVLEHVPDPLSVLRDTARCLRKGGRLIACEVYNRTLLIEPRYPIIDDYFAALSEVQRRSGGHPDIGARLPLLAVKAGLSVHSYTFRHALGDARDHTSSVALIRYFQGIFRSAEPQIRGSGVFPDHRIAEVWDAFDQVVASPDALISYVGTRLEARA